MITSTKFHIGALFNFQVFQALVVSFSCPTNGSWDVQAYIWSL